MRSFIYDQYGYLLEKDVNEFSFEGYDFRLVAHEKSEDEVRELAFALNELKKTLPFSVKSFIVESRNHTLVTENEFGNVSLIAAKKDVYNFNAIIYIIEHGSQYIKKTNYTISNLIDLWEEKLSLIEEKYLGETKIDDYAFQIVNVESIYGIGLASNAIQYLADIKKDYGDSIPNLTLVHKRIESMRSIDIFNPFNFIQDTACRDLSFLYKINEIKEKELFDFFEKLNFSKTDLSLFIARLLFPTYTFDLLEDQYNIKKNVSKEFFELNKNGKKRMQKNALLINHMIKKYALRPIEWLNTVL